MKAWAISVSLGSMMECYGVFQSLKKLLVTKAGKPLP
jgi:hypothetical protein